MKPSECSSSFKQMVQHTPVMVWTALPNGSLDFVNQTVVNYFGRSAAEMIKWGWVDFVHADDLPKTGEAWSLALETGQPYVNEFRLKHVSGNEYRWHLALAWPRRDEQGAIVSWIGTCTDIHHLK